MSSPSEVFESSDKRILSLAPCTLGEPGSPPGLACLVPCDVEAINANKMICFRIVTSLLKTPCLLLFKS